ncbi:hypothetical protein KAF25_003814 [Fusarium avenaceum]|uniref:Uncharacterized protein n=1 Tax=Fusarium avenaceum TaxID=40199 RepID=A0A9P7H8E1_9HYPO|nr:hypothetical protein KAF25_003814 [Fusarium avenaceum]
MDIRGQPPSLYLLMADKTPKRLVPRQGTPTVSDIPLHAKMRNHDDDTPASQVPAPKRTCRNPISKNKPNQTKTRSRSSHKKPDGVPLKKNHEIPKTEPAPQEPASGIMFAQGCELIPGIGLSIPFDGNRIMVLPFDTMPPGLQNFALNNPTCHLNVALEDIDEASLKDIENGVRYVVQALMYNAGLTESECRLLEVWSCQLTGDKIHFFTAHTHTIIHARGNGPFSKYDLSFIHYVASCIKFEAASTNKTLADFAKEHGDILNLAYTNLSGAMAEFTIASSHPETLVNIEAAITELKDVSKALTSIQTLLEEQLQLLHQESEALKK